ncbi:MAG: hypothetical protein ABL914_10890 [Novosphingobium sp.]|uniref:hypothetical protein n=1 Tax=Novosphingobium sp. TaxID=1874826 RepID=UPI0032BCD8F1
MRNLIMAMALMAGLSMAGSTQAGTRGHVAYAKYAFGNGQCLYFQGALFWVAPC